MPSTPSSAARRPTPRPARRTSFAPPGPAARGPVAIDHIDAFLDARRPALWRFWRGASDASPAGVPLIEHCDAVYVLHLTGRLGDVAPATAEAFAARVADTPLAGQTPDGRPGDPAGVHLTAYLLGALNLLALHGRAVHAAALKPASFEVGRLIGGDGLPRWPAAWSHHVWRVSHWVGGAPSILLSLAEHAPEACPEADGTLVDRVLEACDRLIDDDGFLRTYRSAAVQRLFRLAYRLRHDPGLGAVGGIAHLHWVNHARGRPHHRGERLFARTLEAARRRPFMERAPYCLDFDVAQILRTSGGDAARPRLAAYQDDLVAFFARPLPPEMTPHKLPGALATAHECALALGRDAVPGLDVPPRDIIGDARWL